MKNNNLIHFGLTCDKGKWKYFVDGKRVSATKAAEILGKHSLIEKWFGGNY